MNQKVELTEELKKERIDRYLDRIEDKPQDKNQLLVKEGNAVLIVEGKPSICTRLEGYIKLSNRNDFNIINNTEVIIGLLPKRKMIISQDKHADFLGYKSANSQDCCLLIHAVAGLYDLLIIATDHDIPTVVFLDWLEDDEMSTNEVIYENMEYLLKKAYPSISSMTKVIELEDEDDEWE